jgi:hypothetical protein
MGGLSGEQVDLLATLSGDVDLEGGVAEASLRMRAKASQAAR